MTLADYRALFDLPPDVAYLDHAATGVLGRHAHAAAADFLAGHAGHVPARSPNNYPADLARIERLRERAARLVGVPTRNVEVVPNTSAGVNWLAQGLDWQPGDRVAVPAGEFPTNHLPWRGLASRGVAVDLVPAPGGTFTADDVAAVITPRTRVVSVSFVQFLSGFRADLAAISDVCRAHDVLFAVDAIQGTGALRIDAGALGTDLVACGGHKWLCAMHGLGFAAVSDRLLERLVPVRGWLNGPVDWDDFDAVSDDVHPDATRFRTGTLPNAQAYALDASLGAMLDVGPETIEAAVLGHAHRLADGLDALGLRRYGSSDPAHASGIVTVDVPDADALVAHLAAQGVYASARSRKLRLAPHAHTRDADITRALDAVAAFARAGHAAPVSVPVLA